MQYKIGQAGRLFDTTGPAEKLRRLGGLAVVKRLWSTCLSGRTLAGRHFDLDFHPWIGKTRRKHCCGRANFAEDGT